MAFNEVSAQRIREWFYEKNVVFSEKKMFSGICFMVEDKMCCGTHIDKKTGEDFLLCRIGETAAASALETEACIPMEFTGRPMKGFVFVYMDTCKRKQELAYWLQLCLDFNPFAQKSKK